MATRTEQVTIRQALNNQRMVLVRLRGVQHMAPYVGRRTGDWADGIDWALATYRNLLTLVAGFDPVAAQGIEDNDAALLTALEATTGGE